MKICKQLIFLITREAGRRAVKMSAKQLVQGSPRNYLTFLRTITIFTFLKILNIFLDVNNNNNDTNYKTHKKPKPFLQAS